MSDDKTIKLKYVFEEEIHGLKKGIIYNAVRCRNKLNGKEIGHISRKISLRDSFVLTLDDDQDLAFFVAFVIAIDNITDQRSQEAASSSSSNY